MKDVFKKALPYLALLLLLACLGSALPLSVGESSDFGNFAGNSDYGGSWGGGWSGGSSWGDGWSGGGFINLGWVGGSIDVFTMLLFLYFVVRFFGDRGFFVGKRQRERMDMPEVVVLSRVLLPMSDYLKLDPDFSATGVQEHMANLYVQMQNCWHNKNIEPVRPWLTDAFYNQMEGLLAPMRSKRETDYIERIAVLEASLKGYYQAGGMDFLVAAIRTRITVYTLDDRTGRVVSGSRNREKFMEYEWELTRRSGERTDRAKGGVKAVYCPHCGAPLDINASARCSYCGGTVIASSKNWAVCRIRGISQRTV
ncbi:hypothetical protein FF3_00478 [Fretibacterium fastidiosum]|uniref:zinc-ribbon domain-containing transport protein n=2 Tax=Fretibacterium fastidiosum TaxID=651822 RepID=UPI0038FBED97